MSWYPKLVCGSPALARMRWRGLVDEHGEDHPAARAALGRYLALRGWVPQRGLKTPEAVAWLRASGAIAGYRNRRERRAES